MNPIQSIRINDQSAAAIGNTDQMSRPKTGLLCSRKCPADIILFTEKRADSRTIDRRNQLVADLACTLYIPCATPGGNIEPFKGEKS